VDTETIAESTTSYSKADLKIPVFDRSAWFDRLHGNLNQDTIPGGLELVAGGTA
jgi:hypothetical protein